MDSLPKYVKKLNIRHAFFVLMEYFKKSYFETHLSQFTLLIFISAGCMASAAELGLPKAIPKAAKSKVQNQDIEALVEKLKPDAIAVRKDGETVRMRYLRGSKDLPETVRELQTKSSFLLKNAKEAAMGPGSSGGGFSNYYSSYTKTVEDVTAMITQLDRMPESIFKDFLPQEYHDKVTAKKISQALRKIQFSFFQDGISIAPEGMTDILEADYVLAGEDSSIILLKSFFEKYNSLARNDSLSVMRARTILHEITHLFGIGITNDLESYRLSFYLLLALTSDERVCVDIKDCKSPAPLLTRQYSATYLPTIQNEKKLIESAFNNSDLQVSAIVRHGYDSSMSGIGQWRPKNLQKSEDYISLSSTYQLRDILPTEFSDQDQNRFGLELIASLSGQRNISYEDYLASFKYKKLRWGAYSFILFQDRDGNLYSHLPLEASWNAAGIDMAKKFLMDRGSCYGEKIERPAYEWILDERNNICIGHLKK